MNLVSTILQTIFGPPTNDKVSYKQLLRAQNSVANEDEFNRIKQDFLESNREQTANLVQSVFNVEEKSTRKADVFLAILAAIFSLLMFVTTDDDIFGVISVVFIPIAVVIFGCWTARLKRTAVAALALQIFSLVIGVILFHGIMREIHIFLALTVGTVLLGLLSVLASMVIRTYILRSLVTDLQIEKYAIASLLYQKE